MIDQADRDAIRILATASEDIVLYSVKTDFERFAAIKMLHHAIRHLAYPDRGVYPKVRGSRKGDPIRASNNG